MGDVRPLCKIMPSVQTIKWVCETLEWTLLIRFIDTLKRILSLRSSLSAIPTQPTVPYAPTAVLGQPTDIRPASHLHKRVFGPPLGYSDRLLRHLDPPRGRHPLQPRLVDRQVGQGWCTGRGERERGVAIFFKPIVQGAKQALMHNPGMHGSGHTSEQVYLPKDLDFVVFVLVDRTAHIPPTGA